MRDLNNLDLPELLSYIAQSHSAYNLDFSESTSDGKPGKYGKRICLQLVIEDGKIIVSKQVLVKYIIGKNRLHPAAREILLEMESLISKIGAYSNHLDSLSIKQELLNSKNDLSENEIQELLDYSDQEKVLTEKIEQNEFFIGELKNSFLECLRQNDPDIYSRIYELDFSNNGKAELILAQNESNALFKTSRKLTAILKKRINSLE